MPEKHLAVRSDEHPVPFKLTESDNFFENMWKMHEAISRRAYELFEEGGKIFGRDLDDWIRAESELLHPVSVSIAETDEGLRVEVEVPGFKAEELEVSVESRRLTITGKHEAEKKETKERKTIYSERTAESILRVIDLPVEVNTEKVSAMLKNGVLEFTMPKAAPAKTISLETKAA